MALLRVPLIVLFLTLPFVLSVTASARAQQGAVTLEQLTGLYRVDGVNTNGGRYVGEVNIVVRDNTAFFAWEIAGKAYTGKGGIQGNQLVIDWGSSSPVIYTIDAAGNLNGTWDNGRASERLTRLR